MARRRVRKSSFTAPPLPAWEDAAGFHAMMAGMPPSPSRMAAMENELRQIIRSSPQWAELVRKHGTEGVEALLQQIRCRVGP